MVEIANSREVISAPVYEISMGGILVGGAAAEALAQGQSFNAMLQDVGACRIRIVQRSKAGAHAQFETPDAAAPFLQRTQSDTAERKAWLADLGKQLSA